MDKRLDIWKACSGNDTFCFLSGDAVGLAACVVECFEQGEQTLGVLFHAGVDDFGSIMVSGILLFGSASAGFASEVLADNGGQRSQ